MLISILNNGRSWRARLGTNYAFNPTAEQAWGADRATHKFRSQKGAGGICGTKGLTSQSRQRRNRLYAKTLQSRRRGLLRC